jgi:hypothetical protein
MKVLTQIIGLKLIDCENQYIEDSKVHLAGKNIIL